MRLIVLGMFTVAWSLFVAACATIAPQPSGLPFQVDQLSGWWAESYSPQPACDPSNLRVRHVFSEDGKRLEIIFDRPWRTELGMAEKFGATILSATDRTLVIRYDGETRRTRNGQPVEWEMSIAAPGVYRWRETSWDPTAVNTVVGIRCSN